MRLAKPFHKGQTALEYVIIFSIIFAALIPLTWIASQNTEQSRVHSEMQIALDTLITGVNRVYALGPNSKIVVNIYLPRNYEPENSYVDNRTIYFVYTSQDIEYTLYRTSNAFLTGSLPSTWGNQPVTLEMTEGGLVNITQGTPY